MLGASAATAVSAKAAEGSPTLLRRFFRTSCVGHQQTGGRLTGLQREARRNKNACRSQTDRHQLGYWTSWAAIHHDAQVLLFILTIKQHYCLEPSPLRDRIILPFMLKRRLEVHNSTCHGLSNAPYQRRSQSTNNMFC